MGARAELEAKYGAPKPSRAELEAKYTAPPAKTLDELEVELRAAAESGDPVAKKAASIAYLTKQREEAGGVFTGAAADSPEARAAYEEKRKGEIQREYDVSQMGAGKVMLEGAKANLRGKGRAIEQLVTTDPVKSLQLQEEERLAREKDKFITDSGLGGLGGLGTDIGLSIVPGVGVTKTVAAAPAGAKLVTALLGEGAIGGGFGALTPTAPGESRERNVKVGAGLGALIPTLGATLRSRPMQSVADKVLDYTPLLYHRRLNARNVAGRAENDAEVAAVRESNRQLDAQALADETAAVTANNAQRAAQEQTAREQLATSAGWPRAPGTKVELDVMKSEQGRQYGDLITPIQVDVAPVVGVAQAGVATRGLGRDSRANLAGYAQRIADAGGDAGIMPGNLYKDIRSELTSDIRTANDSTHRAQLRNILEALDARFEANIPEELADAVATGRAQYALGSNLQKVGVDPVAGGWDLGAVQRRLDLGTGHQPTREQLYAALRGLPETQRVPRSVASPDRAPLPKFTPEKSEYATMAGTQAALLAAGSGLGVGPLLNLGLPVVAAAAKQAEKERVRKTVAALLRGTNIYSAPAITPQETY